jgi:hypothetical protein
MMDVKDVAIVIIVLVWIAIAVLCAVRLERRSRLQGPHRVDTGERG